MFTSPTINVLAFSIQLQHLVMELKYSVIIADNGAPKSYETQKRTTNKLSFKHQSNHFFFFKLTQICDSKHKGQIWLWIAIFYFLNSLHQF